jgi:SAM-dependent methyltransferase
MAFEWDFHTEVKRYSVLWQTHRPKGIADPLTYWDEQAKPWEQELHNNKARKARNGYRVSSTVDFLRGHGLLRGEDEVIDIGCGPGRFVTAFAKNAGHVIGIDLSPQMTEFGARFATDQGIKNVSFETCDFTKVDIDKKNWRSRFDLVFSSITPALGSFTELEKILAMSRAYCFSSNFVNAFEPVAEEMLRELFKIELSLRWDGRQFYALFNLLWLHGYFPIVTIFKESSEERVQPDRPLAARIARKYLPKAAEGDIQKIQEYLARRADSDGLLLYPMGHWYAWMLWDVRDQRERKWLFSASPKGAEASPVSLNC